MSWNILVNKQTGTWRKPWIWVVRPSEWRFKNCGQISKIGTQINHARISESYGGIYCPVKQNIIQICEHNIVSVKNIQLLICYIYE